tara:strand:+ start:1690 stop:2157 length:468 start_codon:yes stop_codon:yes gene_type:complete
MVIDLNKENWRIVNDTVMGGRSDAKIINSTSQSLLFSGTVSLENNGGFSMIQSVLKTPSSPKATTCSITVKGDGKNYQFRLKPSRFDKESYVMNFKTSGKEETFTFNIADFKPYFRGRSLDLPAIKNQSIEEIAFLIGNKKAESFELEVIEVMFE